MSVAVAIRPADTELVHIARCAIHGLHGERTECAVCGGPVEQVAMVPATVLVGEPCACGCGHPQRPNSDYATDACRTRHWKRETGYVDPRRPASANAANAAQTRLLRPPHHGGRQLSYRKTVKVLADYLVELDVVGGVAQAERVAETILRRALPARQRRRATSGRADA